MDTINIDRLKVFAYHGCDTDENKRGQDFFISLILVCDFDTVCESDNLQDTVNYAEVCHIVKNTFCKQVYNTLEKCANVIVSEVLNYSNLIKQITVRIDKPHAPIGLDFESVSVTVSAKCATVYLGLGSNLGDKNINIAKAIECIETIATIIKKSSSIITKPWGGVTQPDYINMVIEIETTLKPHALLQELKNIERLLGRQKCEKWGARLIDIDILIYDDLIIGSDDLIIPHPYIQEREFVLKPFSDIAPFLIHPVLKRNIQQLLVDLNQR